MNDQEGLIKLLLKYAKDTFPLYFVPPYTERNWIPIILEELNEKQNSYIELNVQLFEDSTPMAKSDKKPCGCHIDDDACIPDWHPPHLPPTDTQYQCKPKPCGCDYITECDKCVPRLY
jgi:hypothetical protein